MCLLAVAGGETKPRGNVMCTSCSLQEGGGDAPLAGEERQRMDNVMCISCLLQKEREREKGRCNVYLSVCLLQEERERREKMMQQVEEGELLVEK